MFQKLPEGLQIFLRDLGKTNFVTNMSSFKTAATAHGHFFVFQYYS